MEAVKTEIQAETGVNSQDDEGVLELNSLQLALVGGGVGIVVVQ